MGLINILERARIRNFNLKKRKKYIKGSTIVSGEYAIL